MINLSDVFQQINDLLPDGKKCTSFSVAPMPYKDYCELYVETADKKRYRCMCTHRTAVSNFVEFKMSYELAKENK